MNSTGMALSGRSGIHVLGRFEKVAKQPAAWSASGLSEAINAFLMSASKGLDATDAAQFLKASTHWLRHADAAHALQGREGHRAVPLQVVQSNLGHVSIGTTSIYLATEREERLKAKLGFLAGPHRLKTD